MADTGEGSRRHRPPLGWLNIFFYIIYNSRVKHDRIFNVVELVNVICMSSQFRRL